MAGAIFWTASTGVFAVMGVLVVLGDFAASSGVFAVIGVFTVNVSSASVAVVEVLFPI